MILSRHVESFIAVAQYQSLAAAAEHLFITSAALSQQMKLLEQEVGVPLFTRSYRGITLTPSGEVFLRKMKLLKKIEEEAKQLALWEANQSLPPLSIAYTHNIQSEELRGLECQLKAEFRQNVKMYAVPFEHAIINTENGVFDACFVPDGKRLAESKLITITYRTEQPYLSVPYDHPLSDKAWISRKDLNNIELVLPERGIFLNIDTVYEELETYDIHPIIVVISDVLESEMYCRIHCAVRICRSHALSSDMVAIPFETDAVSKICFAYSNGERNDAKLKNLISLIRKESIP